MPNNIENTAGSDCPAAACSSFCHPDEPCCITEDGECPAEAAHSQPDGPMGLAAVPLFGLGDELEFRRQFAVQFLATYAATHFDDYCANGLHNSLDHLPVEDAEYLSGTAWRHWCATMPMKPNTKVTQMHSEDGASNPPIA